MNTTALWHLTWKEYRAVRPFWLSMVGLILFLQAVLFYFSTEPSWTLLALCNLALAGPAFFAVGAAGTAFAIEREDGTYDFLRTVPVASREVFVSKLGLAVLATLAMLLVLLPLTLLWTRLQLPTSVQRNALAGLWLMAAVEAIAWGTLFSLLMRRPLPAICLALVATSTAIHLPAWSVAKSSSAFILEPYTTALGIRAVVATLVLLVDVVLGIRWLQTTGDAAARPGGLATSRKRSAAWVSPYKQAKQMVRQSDRVAMFSRLLWQHLRQSWRLMLLLAGLQFGLSIFILASSFQRDGHEYVTLPLAGFAALMGSCVFLADQEQRSFRFFVEHNVPSRYVWLTRNLLWMLVLSVTTYLITQAWQKYSFTHLYRDGHYQAYAAYFYPLRHLALAWVVTSFAAGQWSSMFLRSGLLAGFVGLALSGILCSWIFLIHVLGERWLLFVAPIPIVLMAGTWLRAPDWIRENTSVRARLRAAGAVLIPAACLMAALPVVRVTSIAQVPAPFDVAAYQAEVTPEGLETAALYRRANELFVHYPTPETLVYQEAIKQAEELHTSLRSTYPADRNQPFSTIDAKWLNENAETLQLLLEASQRPSCILFDSQQNPDPTLLWNALGMIRLLIVSGLQLETEGKLDEALDRYFTTLKCLSHWAEHAPIVGPGQWPPRYSGMVLVQLGYWGAQEGQTAARIHGAIQRLLVLDANMLHLADGIKSDYLLGQILLNDPTATSLRLGTHEQFHSQTQSILRFMPWELPRERRLLNRDITKELKWLNSLQNYLVQGVGLNHGSAITDVADNPEWGRDERSRFPLRLAADLRDNSIDLKRQLGNFETDRRAAILVLALQEYRLTEGHLPFDLDYLVGGVLASLPLDPYSGVSFLYFPQGHTSDEWNRLYAQRDNPSPASPCLWSTGSEIRSVLRHLPSTKMNLQNGNLSDHQSYFERMESGQTVWSTVALSRNDSIWKLGNWFLIPPPKKSK